MSHTATQTATQAVDGRRRASSRDVNDRAGLLVELLELRQQLERVASTPTVMQAHRLTAQVAHVLEPVWSVMTARPETGTAGGVGYLRRYGVPDPDEGAVAINAAVAEQTVRIYGSLDLVAPSARDVWLSLARPAEALWTSVQEPHHLPVVEPGLGQPVATVTPTVRPVLPAPLLGAWSRDSEVVPSLRKVLRRWCELARRSSGDQAAAARLTLAAAMLARGAALDGDTETVKWFIDRWLGLRATEPRVDGASAALLENGWTVPTTDSELSAVVDAVTTLRIQTMYQHRLHRPVWETQLRGLPIAILSEEERQPIYDGPSLTLADTLTDEHDASVVDAVTNVLLTEQVHSVLDTLSKSEAEVIYAIASGDTTRKQIMQSFGITRYKLDKIERDAMMKLRHPSRSQFLRDYLE